MRLRFAAPLAALVALAGCCPGGGQKTRPAYEIVRTYSHPPDQLREKVSRRKITVADEVELVLEAVTREGRAVHFPDFAGKLGKFTVAGCETSDPKLVGTRRILVRKRCRLEPFLSGRYVVPPLRVEFGSQATIETTPISVHVVSVLPNTGRTPDIKDVLPPVELPGLGRWWDILLGMALAGAIGAAWVLWRRRRRKTEPTVAAPPPHQVALGELRKLLAEDLIGKGQAKLFYLRLSAILRHYIEARFGLLAPERTTEEFLADLRTSRTLTAPQKQLLKEFLEHCDMVKFAGYQPAREQIDAAVNTCAQFIAETRPAGPPGAAAAPGPARPVPREGQP